MYIDYEKWENLKDDLKNINSNYNYASAKDILNNIDDTLEEIEKTESNKVYVITNNSICDGEIDYQLRGVAFSINEAKKIFNEAIRDAKIDAGFDNPDTIDEDNKECIYDRWHCVKTDNSFELYINGEYSSNNFSIEIKEFDISKSLNKEMEVDL